MSKIGDIEPMSEEFIVGRVSDVDCRERDPWLPAPAGMETVLSATDLYAEIGKLVNRVALLERELAKIVSQVNSTDKKS